MRKPYLIAEAGVALWPFNSAIKLLDAAVNAKCDAFKIQSYNVDNLLANNKGGWKERLKDRTLNSEQIHQLSKECQKKNIDFIITPHDDSQLDIIKDLNLKTIKIGSGEAGNYKFLEKCFEYCENIIYSTGLQRKDIEKAINIAKINTKE